MHTYRQTLFHEHTTLAAPLAGVGRVHLNQLATSFFHFVCQHFGEHPQACVMRGQREMSVRIDEFEVEVFDRDQGITSSQLPGEFVPVVVALVCDLLMQSCHLSDRFAPALAPLLPPGDSALCHPQLVQRCSQPPGIIDQFTFAGRQQGAQAHINPDLTAFWNWLLLPLGQRQHQEHIPPVIDPFDDHMIDHCSLGDWTVVDQLDLADVLQVETLLSILLLSQFAAIPIAVLDALEAVITLEARKARSLSSLDPTEESGEGFVQPAQHLLHAARIQHAVHLRVIVALIPEVLPLVRVADPFASLFIGGDPLFQSGVVQVARLGEQAIEGGGLRSVGTQAVLVCPDHSAAFLLSFDVFPDRFFGDVPDAAYIIRSTPKNRCPVSQVSKLLSENPGSVSLELVCKILWGFGWIGRYKQVNVIGHDLQGFDIYIQLICFFAEQFFQTRNHIAHKYIPPVLWAPDQMIFERKHTASVSFVSNVHHRTIVL